MRSLLGQDINHTYFECNHEKSSDGSGGGSKVVLSTDEVDAFGELLQSGSMMGLRRELKSQSTPRRLCIAHN